MKEETEENEWWEGEESLQDRVLEHCGERIPQWLVWNSQKAQHGAATSTAELLELLEGEAPVWRELYYNLILPLSESVDDVLYGMPPKKVLYATHQVLLRAYADREQRSTRFEANYCRPPRPDENEAVARRRNFAAILLAYALAKDVDDLQLAAFTRNAEAWLARWSTHHPFREEAMEAAKAFRKKQDATPTAPYRIAKNKKGEFATAMYALYEIGLFATPDGQPVTNGENFVNALLRDFFGEEKPNTKQARQDYKKKKTEKEYLKLFDTLKLRAKNFYQSNLT